MLQNSLYPIFLKANDLHTLIVGGGNVALEKLTFLLKSSPKAQVTVVALDFLPEVVALAKKHGVTLTRQAYEVSFLEAKQIVIAATNIIELNKRVHSDCKLHNILVNVADNPPYCDFYMGSIVTKGHLKIAFSTNGKSPTAAKRLRQFFENILPENMNELIENLDKYRKTIKGDFEKKVTKLNELTNELIR